MQGHTMRTKQEALAKRISDEIDAQIKAERASRKQEKPPVKVLLLGQSESGKSTTIKNFQLAYAYRFSSAERIAWRTVIYLNLVRSVLTILDILNEETDESNSESNERDTPPVPSASSTPLPPSSDDLHPLSSSPTYARQRLTELQRLIGQRLASLRGIQRILERRIGSAAWDDGSSASYGGDASQVFPRKTQEFYVMSRTGWRGTLTQMIHEPGSGRNERASTAERTRADLAADRRVEEALRACVDDIDTLWTDADVQALLAARRIRMEETPGFFLDDVHRLVASGYEPNDGDIVRARLRTMGVQEYQLNVDRRDGPGRAWLLYDVGGSRSMRQAWTPYFEDVHAIIFLAPISCFDERLAEDPTVNRVQDSVLLWKAICSNKLLVRAQLILFLNKCDLLRRKLARGVRVADYVSSYGKRSNDAGTAAQFFRDQFKEILQRSSPEERTFYAYLTSMIDTKATEATVKAVREGITRNHLKAAHVF